MPFRLPPRRTIALSLATNLLIPLATGLAGCSLTSSSGKNCDGSEPRLKELAALTILDSRPPHTTVPKNYGSVTTDCNDGSGGDAWLSAYRVYSFPGSKADLFAYYRQVAAANHWTEQQDTNSMSVPPEVEGICFTKGGDGDAILLTVDFRTESLWPAPVDFGAGTGYKISAESAIDGAKTDCWK
ncbi:hypothetical protein [Streptomyces sp. H39-S7]|uniref:hypothetical protein n=1 Tax=Streptomyces sp. H39-S7 TaxID=3004357 RepID=UPI0022AFE60D|nr:hypothetical protein [Streptomyces sp. H39-S7]MCZ4125046.1 hypothetical protein [Streptomyces sp. H39-S7]